MAIQLSTGLRDGLMDTNSFRSLCNGGFLMVYAGTIPATADDSIGGATLLNTYTENDDGVTGLNFAATASGGSIGKDATPWQGEASGSGDATFFRWVMSVGDTGVSTTAIRVQGTVGQSGGDMFVQSISFTATTLYTLDYFNISIPG